MSKQVFFDGSYNIIANKALNSLERMYQNYTACLPSYYHLQLRNISEEIITFKFHFQSHIVDYTILDCQKNAKGFMQYKVCYVLKNDIFVILDEINSSVKILYPNAKSEVLKYLVKFFADHKTTH